MALNIHEKGFVISQKYQIVKGEKHDPFLCLQSSNLARTTRHRHRHGNSLEVRRVSPGRIIVVLFWTKHAFLRQINSSICQVNYFSIVFVFVTCKEKGYRLLSCRFGKTTQFWLPLVRRAHRSYAWCWPSLPIASKRYRGYYMPARGYEFYLRVVNSISHEWAQLTREISSWPRDTRR